MVSQAPATSKKAKKFLDCRHPSVAYTSCPPTTIFPNAGSYTRSNILYIHVMCFHQRELLASSSAPPKFIPPSPIINFSFSLRPLA